MGIGVRLLLRICGKSYQEGRVEKGELEGTV